MSDKLFKVPAEWAKNSYINQSSYEAKYKNSIDNNEKFWAEEGKRIHWFKPYTKTKEVTYSTKKVSIKWFYDGTTNVSYNCIDRHLPKRAKQTAIIFEGDDPKESKNITYQELSDQVCKLANGLKEIGVKRGDRVTIYMPMVPEGVYAMLACTRIGAIHSVVFGGFSPDSIVNRILDCKSEFVITADEGLRGQKVIPLKKNIDEALKKCPNVKKCIVLKRTGGNVPFDSKRDVWYHELTSKMSTTCKPEEMNAEDPLFILYTSGSTGKPKGALHTTGGYLVYASMTHQYIFDYKDGDIYWCTADIGWVTGHSYIVYGPLSNGATTLVFEGVPSYPDASRFWQVIDKHKVNIFYTAPTALRALMREGDAMVKKTSRKSLKLLGSVGEPINPEAWIWYHKVVGDSRCPIVDTWWQTETGGILIAPQPGAIDLKPGSATKPFYGIKPSVVDEKGVELKGACEGRLCMSDSWPGQMRTVYGDHQRFIDTYFSQHDGKYFTGDGCKRDEDGYYWITGRVDDVIIVSGHNLGTAEIESAFVAHPKVAEAAVVGYPHDIKGQGLYCYVTLKVGETGSEALTKELKDLVRKIIGPLATPDLIHYTPGLPKTRSGKIMRRILRKVAENQFENLGDTSTLADPTVVQSLIDNRLNK
ncbi:MAG: acetate--CoA ligase [Candidatus Fonsibacter ubiquis]|jgi:acetyl-CoA synthetase|nr:acetate--CoA ligase [Candidatus Fonsibacter ubiquis]NDB38055.1 acetate--CoA ligase [Pseudomonadota bacterium]GBL33338.1 acetyl-coenzyme A synthetase [Pelagibacterales bacterium]NCU54841.1 acetate--CoA ligase [Candidatus Fonsibacter ubiquis]NDB47772.1 acetate--CoA ligase [Pseudomonadota bacterium]